MLQIAHLEFHDAVVSHVCIGAGRTASVHFDHLCVFVEIAPDRFETWSARAALQCEGVSAVTLQGAFEQDDYISEGRLVDDDGVQLVEVRPDRLERLRYLEITFAGSAARLTISMTRATLTTDALLQRLEDWHGPLTSS